jgi:hypothetical protein
MVEMEDFIMGERYRAGRSGLWGPAGLEGVEGSYQDNE